MNKKNLLGLTVEELKKFTAEMGEAPFRGKQLFRWINKGIKNFDAMTDFSEKLRKKLSECAYISGVSLVDMQIDDEDSTRKFLFGLEDGNAVESVFMKYKYGNSLCISSQVGCRMGCVFCASALNGLVRNLTSAEMLGQIFEAERITGENINHIVVMGNITVSTRGIISGIEKFAADFPQVNLAISLHRLDNEGRSRIMPVNRAYPVDELIEAAKVYTEKTGRRVTFEYTLISGENDRKEDIDLIKHKLSGMLCHINLIPLNKVEETGFSGSSRKRAAEIADILNNAGIAATVRRELGKNIDGACGQLRLKKIEES